MKPLYFFLVVSFFFVACKKKKEPEQAAPTVDECEGKRPVSAQFKILQNLGDGDLVEDDTIACYPRIADSTKRTCTACIFEANEEKALYQWEIGAGKSTNRQYELSFAKAYGQISAKLKVEKMPDQQCFPSDDGKDTVVRVFSVKDYDKHPLIGKYIGTFEDTPNDTLRVEIKPYPFECFRSWVQRGRPAWQTAYPYGVEPTCANSYDGGKVLSIWGFVPNFWGEIPRATSHTLSLNYKSLFNFGFGYEEACFVGKESFGRLKDGILTIEFDFCNSCTHDCSYKITPETGLHFKDGAWRRRKAVLRKIQ